jgi:hypothetical protein
VTSDECVEWSDRGAAGGVTRSQQQGARARSVSGLRALPLHCTAPHCIAVVRMTSSHSTSSSPPAGALKEAAEIAAEMSQGHARSQVSQPAWEARRVPHVVLTLAPCSRPHRTAARSSLRT